MITFCYLIWTVRRKLPTYIEILQHIKNNCCYVSMPAEGKRHTDNFPNNRSAASAAATEALSAILLLITLCMVTDKT